MGGLVTVSSSNPLLWAVSQFKNQHHSHGLTDTTAYAANDAIADSTSAPTLLSFANCANANGQGYIVKTRLLTNQKRVRHVLELSFYHTAPSLLMIMPKPMLYANKDKLIGVLI